MLTVLKTEKETSLGNEEELKKIKNFLEENLFTTIKGMVKLSWPLVLSRIARTAASFNGTRLLSQLGPYYVAAGAPIQSAMLFIIQTASTPFLAVNTYTSELYRDIDQKREDHQFNSRGYHNGSHYWPTSMVLLGMAPQFFVNDTQPQAIHDIIQEYFSIYKYTAIPYVFLSLSSQTLVALGDTLPIGIVNFLAATLSVFLQYGWIEGQFSFPKEAAYGLGKSILVETSVSTAILLSYLSIKIARNPELRSQFSLKDAGLFFLKQSRTGLTYVVGTTAELAGMLINTILIVGRLGIKDLAMTTIVTQYNSLLAYYIINYDKQL